MTLDRARQILETNYARALTMPNTVRDPVAWALYRTWRAADASRRTQQKGDPHVEPQKP